MLAAGKRIIIESNSYVGNNYTNTPLPSAVFWPTTWTDQPGAADLAPFPNCTLRGDAAWYGRGLPRLLDGGDLQWDPSEGKASGIVLKPSGVSDLVHCAVNNVGLADVTPSALAGWVWSWATGEPAPMHACAAAAMSLVRGQWRSRACGTKLRALCRLGDNRVPAGDAPGLWSTTTGTVAFADAPAACAALGSGWAFDVPRDGRENALVALRLLTDGEWRGSGGGGVWLNVRTE